MNKKYIYTVVIVVLGLLLLWGGVHFLQRGIPQPLGQMMMECVRGGRSLERCGEEIAFTQALASGSIERCAYAGPQQHTCAMMVTVQQAATLQDETICAVLTHDTLVGECEDRYALRRAEASGDASWCAQVSRQDWKEECILMADRERSSVEMELPTSIERYTWTDSRLCWALPVLEQPACLRDTEDAEGVGEWCATHEQATRAAGRATWRSERTGALQSVDEFCTSL